MPFLFTDMAYNKSHHQHQKEEREAARKLLEKVKRNDSGKAAIYLKDSRHTVLIVNRANLKKKLAQLKKEEKVIQRIL